MDQVIFFADIKGTKNALEHLNVGGREELTTRMRHLHDAFSETFAEYASRSRSLRAATISDSVIAFWDDAVEGRRFAFSFMSSFWSKLKHNQIACRGFLERGDIIAQESTLSWLLNESESRFISVMPPGVALWSIAVAEASHFPVGLYVSSQIASWYEAAWFSEGPYVAGPFEYRGVAQVGSGRE